MHFYFFASLAFLLVYRDWRLILIAAGAIAVHHLLFMVLQQGGAPVWVMPEMHLSLGMVLLHAVFVVFESIVLIVLSRSMEEETLAAARMRVADAAERAELATLADALERRDLSVSSGTADGAAAILRSGIGQVASLVETIQSTAVEISADLAAGLRGLRRVRALQRGDRRTPSTWSPRSPSSRRA